MKSTVIYEKFKFLFLVLLIITSMVQVGILWEYDRFPISFLWTFLGNNGSRPEVDINDAGDELFTPCKMVISEGKRYSLVDTDTEDFEDLWAEAKTYISDTVLSKDSVPEKSDKKWSKLILKEGVIFEFNTEMRLSLIAAFLNKTVSPSAPGGIDKLAIMPNEDYNGQNTVYISYGGAVYKYVLPFKKWSKYDFLDKITQYRDNKDKYHFDIVYKYFGAETNLNENILIGLQSTSEQSYYKMRDISCVTPETILSTPENNTSVIAEKILGKHQEPLFEVSGPNNGIIELEDLNSRYTFDTGKGMLEYTYRPGLQDDDKGNTGAALVEAYKFINRIRNNVIPGVKIHISGIKGKDSSGYYEFNFDYTVNGIPVYFVKNEGTELENAITVKANGGGVAGCRWLIRDIKTISEPKDYNVYYDDYLYEQMTERNAIVGDKNKKNTVTDISFAYVVENQGQHDSMAPSWFVRYNNIDFISLPQYGVYKIQTNYTE